MIYEPIQDLPPEALALADSEVPALVETIRDYRNYLSVEKWEEFRIRVAREWAIETGQIEGLYQFERGITYMLLEQGITASRIPRESSSLEPEQVAQMINDHLQVIEGLFALVHGDRPISKSYINELHQALLRNQRTHRVYSALDGQPFEKKLTPGLYKKQANSPTRPDGSVIEFCPPEHVDAEMDRLVEIHAKHQHAGIPTELQAAWLHHAFTHIHPYPDGNGRVARALATGVLIKGGLMPLVVANGDKQLIYIPAVEQADYGNYEPLINAFRLWQRRLVVELSQRVEFVATAEKPRNLDDLLGAMKLDLLRQDLVIPDEWRTSEAKIRSLKKSTADRLGQVMSMLASTVKPDTVQWTFHIVSGGIDDTERAALAKLGFPTTGAECQILELRTEVTRHLVITIGKVNPKYRGLGIAAAFFRSESAKESLGEPFLITFAEREDLLVGRFSKWLEDKLLKGISKWRQLQFGV